MNYKKNFYSLRDDFTKKSAQEVLAVLNKIYKPRSVVDVGCGVGTWLKVFKSKGVKKILGIDSSDVPNEFLTIKQSEFLVHNLEKPIKLNRRYDLAICLEVAEHLPKNKAKVLVASLTRLSDVVLFSGAIPMQGGVHHVNEQWPSYWIDKFQAEDYVLIDAIRPKIWNNEKVVYWYRQNMLMFVKKAKKHMFSKIGSFNQVVDIVHPESYIIKHNQANNLVYSFARNVKEIVSRIK